MPAGKRKYDAVTPTKPRSASVSSRGSYRSRPETESEEDEWDASPQIISKKPKLFSTPSKSRKKPAPANSQPDEIDFLAHPTTPEPTPSKTPRTKGAKTPKTVKRAATGIVVVSRSQGSEDAAPRATASTPSKPQRRTSPSKSAAAKAFDLDATPRADASRASNLFSQLAGEPVINLSGSSQGSPLKPAVPGAARGRKKAPARQLLRDDGTVSSASHSGAGQDATYSSSASAGGHSSAANSDAEAPIPTPAFSKLKGGTPKKVPGSARKLHASPNKRALANGDVYVDYMVPMGGADENEYPGLSSGDEGAYISSSADDSEAPLSRPKPRKSPKRGLFGPGDSYSLASHQPPSASRSSSVSRPPSALNYTTSSPYTSRGPSPSPSFPLSQANTSDSESDSDKSIYDHQHHVDPVRHLDKLASLARMALTSAEDMRKKGVMREGDPPLPKCFLTGVVVERGKSRANKVPDSPSKDRVGATETESEGGEEVIIIRALPERRLGEVDESLPRSRSRSWMDTVLSGPAGPTQQNLSRQTSSSSIATDAENPFDNSQTPFRRTNSQSSISGMGPKRPDLTKGLPTAHSEPALETVLAAYDMTPSRTRTIPMTPSKSRLMATPSRTRLFGTPSHAVRMKELEEEEEEPPTGQEFNAWFSKQQSSVLRALRDPPWAAITGEEASGDSQSAVGKATEIGVAEENNETEAVIKLRTLLRRTVETGEGNSCLLVGPRGSGKTRTVIRAIRTLNRVLGQSRSSTPPPSSPTKRGGKPKIAPSRGPQAAATPTAPIVIHLSGHAQTNDRLAMREVARQLVLQSGEALDVPPDDADQEIETLDGGPSSIQVPTATHLPQIVGALARQVRPVIVVLDAFDLFAEHARQALLYCLLDTVQSCRAGQGSQGLVVVGVTSRIDCITMLEKRVKSRFSHRIIRVSPPTSLDSYVSLVVSTMTTPVQLEKNRLLATPKKHKKQTGSSAQRDSWQSSWKDAIDRVVIDRQFKQVLEDIFDLSRDVRLLLRILSGAVASLTPSSPWINIGTVARSIQAQCAPLPFTFLQELAYPSVTLLIATQHIHDKGHDMFTFKMLCDEIKRELGNEAVTKALVQMQGRGLGLMRVPEPVLEAAFERLVTHKIVLLAGAASNSTGRAYVKYRCVPDRSDIKEAVERLGHSALKRWFVQGASS